MRKLIIIAAVVSAVLGGWIGWRQYVFNASKVRHSANVADFESNISEALARGIFNDLRKEEPKAFFLAFGENLTSPSEDFIARFSDVQPKVESFQASVMPPNGMIIDKANGHMGLIIQIIKIKPYIADEWEAEIAISRATGWDHSVYRVSSIGGEWKVKRV